MLEEIGLGIVAEGEITEVKPLERRLEPAAWRGGDGTTERDALVTELRAASSKALITDSFEKIVGRTNLVDVYRIRLAARLVSAVGLIRRADQGAGTGFLIAEDRVITNHHVLSDRQDAKNGSIYMDYERGEDGQPTTYIKFRLRPDRYFHAVAALDYAIVAIDRRVTEVSPGDPPDVASRKRHEASRSIVSLAPADLGQAVEDHDAFIIQHPRGDYKMIAAADNPIRAVNDTFIQYLTDTQNGSSGSPVFDEWFRLIALHHQGGDLFDLDTGLPHFCNQGVNIRAIVADMPPDFRVDQG